MEYNGPEPVGTPRRQSPGIDGGQEVLLDETAGVSLLAGARAQAVFERCQRADPATVLDEDTPQRARDVNDRDPSPAPREKAAEHHEQNEQRVERDNGVREQPVDHA